MFKSICIKPHQNSYPINPGFLAENLLYYQQVNLIVDNHLIPDLVNKCGIDVLSQLVNEHNLKLHMREKFLCVSEKQVYGNNLNNVVLITAPLDKEELIYKGLYTATGRKGHSRRMTSRLMPLFSTLNFDDQICNFVMEDLNDSQYVKESISEILKLNDPKIKLDPKLIHYEWKKFAEGYVFNTNLNFAKINQTLPSDKQISVTSLILDVMDTRGDIYLASLLNAEMGTTSKNTSLMKLKFKNLYDKVSSNNEEIFQLNDFTLGNGYAIREAINSGEKSLKDFINVLEKAEKFKNWLSEIGEDKKIIKEYHLAVTKETWIERLPAKVHRWLFFAAAGFAVEAYIKENVAPSIGIGLSLADTFLLDKILKGWKPNIFVESNLKPFITDVQQ